MAKDSSTELMNTTRNGGGRNSSIELMRIIIMFMILILHANFFTFDIPVNHNLTTLLRCNLEGLTIMAVNVFVLITGYFGTSFRLNKVLNLGYQAIFAVVPIALGYTIYSHTIESFKFWGYWFINAYVGLLILSPILNTAVNKFSKTQHSAFLIIFYTLLGFNDYLGIWYLGFGFTGGYSILWFIFLYMAGRFLAKYPLKIKNINLVLIFIGSLIGETAILFFKIRNYFNYDNPLLVLQSMSFFLFFTKFQFQNRLINYVAASTTMVYLLNLQPQLCEIFKSTLWKLYASHSMVTFAALALAFCIGFFILSILYDQLRVLTWRWFSLIADRLSNKLYTITQYK